MTNGDKIRSMSDAELAMILEATCPPKACECEHLHSIVDCYACWMEYLQKEVEFT